MYVQDQRKLNWNLGRKDIHHVRMFERTELIYQCDLSKSCMFSNVRYNMQERYHKNFLSNTTLTKKYSRVPYLETVCE